MRARSSSLVKLLNRSIFKWIPFANFMWTKTETLRISTGLFSSELKRTAAASSNHANTFIPIRLRCTSLRLTLFIAFAWLHQKYTRFDWGQSRFAFFYLCCCFCCCFQIVCCFDVSKLTHWHINIYTCFHSVCCTAIRKMPLFCVWLPRFNEFFDKPPDDDCRACGNQFISRWAIASNDEANRMYIEHCP